MSRADPTAAATTGAGAHRRPRPGSWFEDPQGWLRHRFARRGARLTQPCRRCDRCRSRDGAGEPATGTRARGWGIHHAAWRRFTALTSRRKVAVREMTGVLEARGHLIGDADNPTGSFTFSISGSIPCSNRSERRCKPGWADPKGDQLRTPSSGPVSTRSSGFYRLLADGGLHKVRCTLGFGLFTVFGRPALPTKAGIRPDLTLERAADNGAPVVRSLGSQYLVLVCRLASTLCAGQPA